MDSPAYPAVQVTPEVYIQTIIQNLRGEGWVFKDLEYEDWSHLLPGIITDAQRVFPTLTSDKIQELVIETETGIDVASLNSLPAAPGNPPRSALAPEAIANLPRPPVRQTKIESWLLTSKTAQPPIPSGSSDAPKSLDIPADVDIPAEVSSEHKLLPSSFSNYGWKLFDHELRVATDYKLAKQDTKPFKDWIPAQGHRHLFDLLKKCTHPDIWEHCVDGDKAFDRDFLLGLPSREIDSPGWYLIVLYDEEDISWWRDYVGQSGDVTRRWRKHQCASTNELFQALIYEVWRNGEPIPEDGNLPRQAKFISLGCDVSGFDDDVDAAPPSRRPLTIPKHSTTTPFRSCTARYRFSSSEHPRMQVQGQDDRTHSLHQEAVLHLRLCLQHSDLLPTNRFRHWHSV